MKKKRSHSAESIRFCLTVFISVHFPPAIFFAPSYFFPFVLQTNLLLLHHRQQIDKVLFHFLLVHSERNCQFPMQFFLRLF